MSTNNHHALNGITKEVRPEFDITNASWSLKKLSSQHLQTKMKNEIGEITGMSLEGKGIEKIEDLLGFVKLRRLDLSKNHLKRLGGMQHVSETLTMLNLADNEFYSDKAFEEFRYLKNLRTLNIGGNDKVLKLESHIVKPLEKLQALIAHQCGFSRASFVKFLPNLNTLVLSKNQISKFHTSCSENLTALTKLSLGHNQITSWPSLEACQQLQELRLNNNFIETIPERVLRNKKIKTLDLGHNRIIDWEAVRILTKYDVLTNLTLKGNPLPQPDDATTIVLREDYASEKKPLREEEVLYRRFVLSLFQTNVGEKGLPKIKLIVFDMKRVKMKFSHTRDQKGEAQPLSQKQKVGKKWPLKEGEVDYTITLDFEPTAKIVKQDIKQEQEPQVIEKMSRKGNLMHLSSDSGVETDSSSPIVIEKGEKLKQHMKIKTDERRERKREKKEGKKRKEKEEERREMILEEMVMSEDEDGLMDGLNGNYIPNENSERSSTDLASSGVVKTKQIKREKKEKKRKRENRAEQGSGGKKKGKTQYKPTGNTLHQVLSGTSSLMNTFGHGSSESAW